MAVDESEIKSLAALAHVALTEDEVRAAAAQMERLLGYIALIQAIDVTGAEETLPGQEPLRFRPDRSEAGLPRATIMASAPAAPLGLFEVPRVVVRSGPGATSEAAADDEVAP